MEFQENNIVYKNEKNINQVDTLNVIFYMSEVVLDIKPQVNNPLDNFARRITGLKNQAAGWIKDRLPRKFNQTDARLGLEAIAQPATNIFDIRAPVQSAVQESTKSVTVELVDTSPEAVRLRGISDLFGENFRQAYSRSHILNIDQANSTAIQQEAQNNLVVDNLLKSIGGKLDGLSPNIRIFEVQSKVGDKPMEMIKYAAIEHNIRTNVGGVNDQVNVMEIINVNYPAIKGYNRQDIVFKNQEGHLYSVKRENDITDDYLILDPERSCEGCTVGIQIETGLLNNEEGILALNHELGHRDYAKFGDNIYVQLGEARKKIRSLMDRLSTQPLSSLPEAVRLLHRNYLALFIENEHQGWYQGRKKLEHAISKGFPIITGNVDQIFNQVRDKFLGSYQKAYQPICDFFGLHFI